MEALPIQDGRSTDTGLLNQAFDSFSIAASKFERYFQHLVRRVMELDLELKSKNEALEKNLKEKEEIKNYLHNILESLTTGVIVIDLNGKITIFNRAAEDLTGLSATEVTGKNFDEVFAHTLIQDDFLTHGSFNAVPKNTSVEAVIIGKDKDARQVSLSLSAVNQFQKGSLGIVITFQDITQIKKLEEQANRNDRLSAMGEMAVNIAHEIRNPLGSIELFASILKKELENVPALQTLAEHISSGVTSINSIVSNVLLFIKPQQKPEFQRIDIQAHLKDSLLFFGHLIKPTASIEIIAKYNYKKLMVLADPELLRQVYLNLLLNAVQAMPRGGKIIVETSEAGGPQPGRSVQIRFSDTGVGIPKKDLSRIFDPFFTTKERGTGIGLAIVHHAIRSHGGAVDIDSVEGKGTSLIVTLPLCEVKKKKAKRSLKS